MTLEKEGAVDSPRLMNIERIFYALREEPSLLPLEGCSVNFSPYL